MCSLCWRSEPSFAWFRNCPQHPRPLVPNLPSTPQTPCSIYCTNALKRELETTRVTGCALVPLHQLMFLDFVGLLAWDRFHPKEWGWVGVGEQAQRTRADLGEHAPSAVHRPLLHQVYALICACSRIVALIRTASSEPHGTRAILVDNTA